MKRFKELIGLLVFVTMNLWEGIDYLLIRDGTGLYSYYGSLNPHAEVLFSSLMILGALFMLVGIRDPKKNTIEVGFRVSGMGWMIYGAGFAMVMPAVWLGVPDTAFVFKSWFSQMGIAVTYLSVAYIHFSAANYVSRNGA